MKPLVFYCLLAFPFFSQKPLATLPPSVGELSGLVFVNDTTLVGHNDGGNGPVLYFFNLKGELLHTCNVTDTKNIDWEDICYDGSKYLYVGDFGNNNNARRNLKIIRINALDALNSTNTSSTSYEFDYPEQKLFPESPENKHFDAEALAFYKDKLYIFTKCRTEPWDGKSYVYELTTDMENQSAKLLGQLYIGKSGWWQDAVTGVDIKNDLCYVLTYNRLMVYSISNNKMQFLGRTYLEPITQKEAVAVNSKDKIIIGDENSKMIGGGFLYQLDNLWTK